MQGVQKAKQNLKLFVVLSTDFTKISFMRKHKALIGHTTDKIMEQYKIEPKL